MRIDERIAAPPSGAGGASGSGSSSGGSSGSGLSISGTVLDALGNPVEGKSLSLSLNGTQQKTTTTDADGFYTFSVQSGGGYSVSPPSIAGCTFAPTVSNFNRIATSQVANFQGSGAGCGGTPVSTLIPPGGNVTINGVISAADGNGVSGVEVDVTGYKQFSTHTDAHGLYEFPNLPAPAGGASYSIYVPAGCGTSAVNGITTSRTVNFAATGCPEGASASTAMLDARYAPHVFTKTFGYSAANRVTSATTGADVPDLTKNGSQVNIAYDVRGALAGVGSSYGTLLTSQTLDPSGSVTQEVFGDVAKTNATMVYDNNESLVGSVLQRSKGTVGAAHAWTTYAPGSSAPTAVDVAHQTGDFTVQTVLSSTAVTLDGVRNVTGTLESAPSGPVVTTVNPNVSLPAVIPSEWLAGSAPTGARSFGYDDAYRLQSVATAYLPTGGGSDDVAKSPYTSAAELTAYPQQNPVSTQANQTRPRLQTYQYDFRGNMTSSTDDKNDFVDRSLGVVGNGPGAVGAAAACPQQAGSPFGPDQFAQATAQVGAGTVCALYDAAGHVTSITDTLTATAYTYQWDEVGQLANATREDAHGQVGEQFAYDAGGARARSTRIANGAVDHTVQVFDSLVLLHAGVSPTGDYERDDRTEHLYLNAGGATFGHVLVDAFNQLPTAGQGNGNVHVFMPMADLLGSTAFLIDHDTSELVEAITYQPYGGVESDYRPARWKNFREDVRYTSHWDDSQVGLMYFGARYYSATIARWISPDPLTVHGLAADPNPYAFVRGSPMTNVDSFGLDADGPSTLISDTGTGDNRTVTFGDDPIVGSRAAYYAAQANSLAAYSNDAQQGAGVNAGPDQAAAAAAENAGVQAGAGQQEGGGFGSDPGDLGGPIGGSSCPGSCHTSYPSSPGSQTLAEATKSMLGFGLEITTTTLASALGPVNTANAVTEDSLRAPIPAVTDAQAAAALLAAAVLGAVIGKAGTIFASRGVSTEAIQLTKQLASDAQVAELKSGLTDVIAGPGGRTALHDAPRLAATYGGSPSDWAKIRSTNFQAFDGTSFETHAYKNLSTGQIVEFKTKFQ
jgi:RHS repeat-associated protein